MPKPSELSYIINALEKKVDTSSPQFNPHYFIFLLGTDTVFVPKPTKGLVGLKAEDQKAYEHGETLSYVAQVVAKSLDEKDPEIINSQPLSFSTPSVDVLNGPTTLGTEVGERIAQAVFLILKALAEGKKTIQIPAHSRGAVEALLVTHELDRIKKELKAQPNKTLKAILSASPCTSYTAKAFAAFKDVNENEIKETAAHRNELLTRLTSAPINLFLIDPVPGGRFMLIPGIAWRDNRFFEKPPCNHIDLTIVAHERTRCFMPIIPQDCTPLIIPGHHGTASGNQYSQQLQPVSSPKIGAGTASVQNLMVCKLLHFINCHTNLFAKPSLVSLSHRELDKVTNDYLSQEPKNRRKKILDLYEEVLANEAAFQEFTKTAYSYLGSECTSSNTRWVHYGAHNYVGLDSIEHDIKGSVNREHALLSLHHAFNFELETDDTQPDLLIKKLEQVLTHLIDNFSKDGPENKLKSEGGIKVAYNFLAFFIDTISQRYLKNHLDVKKKTILLDRIENVFNALDANIKIQKSDTLESNKLIKIINQFKTMLRKGLKNTIEIHYKSLLEQSEVVNEKLFYGRDPNGLTLAFHKFINLVTQSNNDECLLAEIKFAFDSKQNASAREPSKEDKATRDATEKKALKELNEFLTDFLAMAEKISPITVENIKIVFNKFSESIEKNPTLEIAFNLLQNLSRRSDCRLNGYFEFNPEDEKTFIDNLETVHENMNNLIEGLARVQKLVCLELLAIDVDLLAMHRDRAVKNAAEFLLRKKIDLPTISLSKNPVFYQEIKEFLRANAQTIEQLNKLNQYHEQQNKELTLNVVALRKDIEVLNQKQKSLIDELGESANERQLLLYKIKEIQDKKAVEIGNYNKLVSELAVDNTSIKKNVDVLENKVAEIVLDNKRLTFQKSKLSSEIERLTQIKTKLEQSKSEFDSLQEEHQRLKQQSSAEIEHLKSERGKLQEQLEQFEQQQKNIILELQVKLNLNNSLQKTIIALNNQLDEHSKTKDQLAIQLNSLRNDLSSIKQQYQVIANERNNLQKVESELVEQNNRLKNNIDELRAENNNLKSNLSERINLVNGLNETHKAIHEQFINLKTHHDALTQQHGNLKKNLGDMEAKSLQIQRDKITELNKANEANIAQAEAHRQEMTELKKTSDDYTKKVDQKISDLEKTQDIDNALIIQLKADLVTENVFVRQLNSRQEVECANLIHTTLTPLTENYLSHLVTEAKKINPAKDASDYNAIYPQFSGAENNRITYDKIRVKFEAVKQLLSDLNDVRSDPLPSKRIERFTISLKAKEAGLKEHRDDAWKYYLRNTIIAIGVVCTGIIPGIAVLVGYSMYAKKSSPLFFTKSMGGECADKLQYVLAKSTPAA